MIANVIGILFILAWTGLIVRHFWKIHKEAKVTGMPKKCCGCSGFKSGQCPSQKGTDSGSCCCGKN